MSEERLLKMIHDECKKSSNGRANRAAVEQRFGAGFEEAFLKLMYQDYIAKNGPADTISLLPTGEEEAAKLVQD